MKNKTTLAAGSLLLLAGIVVVYLKSTTADPAASDGGDRSAAGVPAAAGGTAAGSGYPNAPATSSSARARAEMKHRELVAQYGESRTKLAATVSNNVIAVLGDAVEIGEKALAGDPAGPFGGRAGMAMALGKLGGELKLTPEQQDQAVAAYQAFQRRELDRSKASLERLKADPAALMNLVLASDATASGKMTEDEYKQLQSTSAEELKGVVNPLDEKNFRGGKPLRDEAFGAELRTTLDPAQSEALEAELAKQAAEPAPDPNAGNISNIPKMDLEKMDQTMTSVRQLTIGFKSMMEGMSGLQDLKPPEEPQPQPKPEERPPE
jgi:hypothetical protein